MALLDDFMLFVALALGAIVGVTLNYYIYRLPRGLSVRGCPLRTCPACAHQLGAFYHVPLLNSLLVGKACPHCNEPIPLRFIGPELVNAIAWMGVWRLYLLGPKPDVATATTYSLFASTIVVMIFIDLEVYVVPDQVNALILTIGIGYNLWLYAQGSTRATTWGMPSSVAGALLGIGFAWGAAFLGRIAFGRDCLGHGDIKLTRGVGAVLFPVLLRFSCEMLLALLILLPIIRALVPRRLQRAGEKPSSASDLDSIESTAVQDDSYEPEPIGSLFKCGLGYVLCFDVVGLFVPRFYEFWFGEPSKLSLNGDELEPDTTLLPSSAIQGATAILTMAIFKHPY